jgi:hypothetical protein
VRASDSCLRYLETRFFDHQSLGDGDIIFIGKEFWVRNVFVFIQRIKDVTALKGSEIVRTNLPTCLRGAAQRWYSDELNDRDKIALRVDLSQWYTALAKRFWENPMVATRKLNEVRYIRQDIRNGVTPISLECYD